MIKYFFLMLLTYCESKIEINITTSHFANKTKITFSGNDLNEVTEKEIKLFNLTSENLKSAVRVELGNAPDEIFLKDPTNNGDLYKKFKWPEVRRKLVIRNAKIVEFITEYVELKCQEFINNTTLSIKSNINISEMVTNSATSTYKTDITDDKILFDVFINFGYGNATYEALWRDNATKNFNMRLTKTKSGLEIPPGKTIKKKLLADKITMLIKIDFEAHLVGNIIANYVQLYGKHHFWAPTIGNIMASGNLTNKINTKMLLEVIFYANDRLKVVDKDTGSEIVIFEKGRKRRYFNFRWFAT